MTEKATLAGDIVSIFNYSISAFPQWQHPGCAF